VTNRYGKIIKQAVWGLVCALLVASNAPASQGDATEMVRSASERMLSALEKNRARIDRDPRIIYSLVDDLLVPYFDFDKITRAAVGKSWTKATPEQQKVLVEEFREILIRTYAKSLLNYSGQKIRYLPEKPGRQPSSVIVSTEVREAGSPPVAVDYRVYQAGGKWKVYDVIIDQVSLVANYRSSFAAQIRQGGIDGLVARLEEMNAKGEG
jgi:phospholipid transport system substrate-binding protein